ncbi:MAG TPA: J domain-containing protein [Candidatus Dormibacteraeota bacterium]|jgi:DnaJ-class molecular chaperone|nr:J domain-containing protein [Candidatus Dormibacteraeota bacterium]
MPQTKDFYESLGVDRNASQKDIQSAFRRLARKYHPDVNPGDKSAEQRFKEISEAHDVLSDPEKRKRYDLLGAQWDGAGAGGGPGPQARYQTVEFDPEELRNVFKNFGFGGGTASQAPPEGGGSFSDLFGSVFGRNRARPDGGTAEVPSMEQELTVSLREAYLGTHRRIELPDGRKIEVAVKPGVLDGTVLRLPGALARVRVAPDREFERDGKNLRVVVQVPLRTALLGGEVQVPTLKGPKVSLTVPAETQNGARLRLRGLGMPDAKGGDPGDLLAEVRVRLPLPLDEQGHTWADQAPA